MSHTELTMLISGRCLFLLFFFFFFFKQKTAYEIGLGIPAEPLFRSAVGALRLSPLRRGLAIDSTVDIFTFYVPHRHVYGEQWIKFMKDGVAAISKTLDRKSVV